MKKFFKLRGIWLDEHDVIPAHKALLAKKIEHKLPNQGLHFDPLTAIVVFVVTVIGCAVLTSIF